LVSLYLYLSIYLSLPPLFAQQCDPVTPCKSEFGSIDVSTKIAYDTFCVFRRCLFFERSVKKAGNLKRDKTVRAEPHTTQHTRRSYRRASVVSGRRPDAEQTGRREDTQVALTMSERRSVRVLNVAEKPSVARTVSRILSGNTCQMRTGPAQYNPIYEFTYTLDQEQLNMVCTSMLGACACGACVCVYTGPQREAVSEPLTRESRRSKESTHEKRDGRRETTATQTNFEHAREQKIRRKRERSRARRAEQRDRETEREARDTAKRNQRYRGERRCCWTSPFFPFYLPT
jgi:hypothetical protein